MVSVQQENNKEVTNDLYDHMSRLEKLSVFAQKSMDSTVAESYRHDVNYIIRFLENNLPLKPTLMQTFRCLENAAKAIPQRKYSLIDCMIGKYAEALKARRLAATHAVDLAWSYRRFIGIHPGEHAEDSELIYSKWAKHIVKSHVETLQQ